MNRLFRENKGLRFQKSTPSFLRAECFFDRVLYCAGNNECADTRYDAPSAACRILRVGCGRYGNLAGNGCKLSGALRVGVICSGSPCGVIEFDGKIAQRRIESVGNNNIVTGVGGCIPEVLNEEGIGQRSVFRYGNGGNAL